MRITGWGSLVEKIQSVAPLSPGSGEQLVPRRLSRSPEVLESFAAEKSGVSTKSLAVIPAMSWDWPTRAGLVSPEQHNFADFTPISPETSNVYIRSSNSFSSNYKFFIEVLDSTAPPSGAIQQAVNGYNNPDYRTFVNYTIRPVSQEPSYYIQNYKDWLKDVAQQSIPEADRTVRYRGKPPPTSEPGLLAARNGNGWTEIPLKSALQQLETTAQAWGRIPVSPAQWYSSGFVGIKANGPYLKGYSRNERGGNVYFFGAGGLLSSRVAELIVAYKPTVKLTVNGQLSSPDSHRLISASEARIGPVQYPGMEIRVDTDEDGNTVVSGTAKTRKPYIVGVTVELYA